MTAALLDVKTRVSAAMLVAVLVVVLDENAPMTIEDTHGDGLKTGELSGDEVAVGGRCCDCCVMDVCVLQEALDIFSRTQIKWCQSLLVLGPHRGLRVKHRVACVPSGLPRAVE